MNADPNVTRVGTTLWSWAPWAKLAAEERNTWLALYTSEHAKRLPPGLWHGGWGTMADAARAGAQQVIESFGVLVRAGLVEHDQQLQVARLVELPDRCERPFNGNGIKGWWTKFRTVPACAVRDRWVETASWLVQPMTAHHQKAWDETFGTLVAADPVPARVSRESAQVELPVVNGLGNRSGNGSPSGDVHVATNHPEGMRNVWDQDPDPDRDRGNGSGSGSESDGRPPLPFTVAQVLAALETHSVGRFVAGGFDNRLAASITGAIRQCAANSYTLADVELAGAWIGAGGLAWKDNPPGPKWVSTTGNLVETIALARAWDAQGRPPLRGVRAASGPGRAAPAPAAAFVGGRRKL